MTQRVLEWTTARLREGEAVALASVITAQGSVPGNPERTWQSQVLKCMERLEVLDSR